jgi:hypothetical protein
MLEIVVAEGYYSESYWDIPTSKNVHIHGGGKDLTYVTSGLSYNNYFIKFEGFFFLLLLFFLF